MKKFISILLIFLLNFDFVYGELDTNNIVFYIDHNPSQICIGQIFHLSYYLNEGYQSNMFTWSVRYREQTYFDIKPKWSSLDSNIVQVKDDYIIGKSLGKTTIVCNSVLGIKAFDITVVEHKFSKKGICLICNKAKNKKIYNYFSSKEIQKRLIKLKKKKKFSDYADWGDEKQYYFYIANLYPILISSNAKACAAFSCEISDKVFGQDTPIRQDKNWDNLRVGDMFMYHSSPTSCHIVTIYKITKKYIYVCEGNFSGMVLWGRRFTRKWIKENMLYHFTRYPIDYSQIG